MGAVPASRQAGITRDVTEGLGIHALQVYQAESPDSFHRAVQGVGASKCTCAFLEQLILSYLISHHYNPHGLTALTFNLPRL